MSHESKHRPSAFHTALWSGVLAVILSPIIALNLAAELSPLTAEGASLNTNPTDNGTRTFSRFHKAPEDFTETPTSAGRYDNVTGVYLTVGSITRTKFLDDTIASVTESNAHPSIVFDVKGSRVFFQSKEAVIGREKGIVTDSYDLKEILDKMHEKGIYTIARVISLKDDGLYKTAPEAHIKHPKTGVDLSPGWVDPTSQTTLDYNRQVICEIAKAGMDEINLDYIRMSTSFVGALSAFTGQQKADRVEVFVKMVRDTINECNPKTKLGISTYAILGWNYEVNLETLGQDVKRFAPYVDIISPMAYPATFAEGAYYRPGKDPGPRDYFLVYRTLTGYAKFLGDDQAGKLRPWIQGYGVAASDVRDQIRAVYDAGACGYQVWNANNNYGQTFAAMKDPPKAPERCL